MNTDLFWGINFHFPARGQGVPAVCLEGCRSPLLDEPFRSGIQLGRATWGPGDDPEMALTGPETRPGLRLHHPWGSERLEGGPRDQPTLCQGLALGSDSFPAVQVLGGAELSSPAGGLGPSSSVL